MITVNISTLKNQLSAVLKKVKKGEEVLVVDRTQPVAKISQAKSSDIVKDTELHLAEMERRGVIKRAKRKKLSKKWFDEHPPIKTNGSVVELLLKEREEAPW